MINRDRRHVGVAVDEMIGDPLSSGGHKPQHLPAGRHDSLDVSADPDSPTAANHENESMPG